MSSKLQGAPAPGDPINILIVDDEPANLLVLESVLDNPGYRFVRAQSADQALLALVEQEFALLILDIRLPDLTGFELAQLIKQRRKTADVPIIFMTAYYDQDQHMLEGYGSGAVDYLNKPVNPAILRSKVRVFADLHRKSRDLVLANRALSEQIDERLHAEVQLRELNDTLERRVGERSAALLAADHKLQSMMNSITDGLLTLDRDWKFTYCNEQGARLLGMQAGELLGQSVWELFPQVRGTGFESGYRQSAQSQQTLSFEEFYPAPLERWFQCHCYPSAEGLSVYFHDITERREIEARRDQLLAAEQAARSEGERVARTKEEFLTLLSHELRTPLAAIVGWAKVLARPGIDTATVRRGIEAIARNAQTQTRLVDDLLDMGRIVSGKLRMNFEPVELNAIAAAAADSAHLSAQHQDRHVEVQLARGGATTILGDPVRLQQIATNLVSNALKFTPAGGLVTICTTASASHVELTVSDNGQGIAAEFLPRLFERFSQGNGSAARLHGGLGLGLSIVKNLVEMHSGTISVSSAGEGLGSTFRVRFPAVPDSGRQAPRAEPLTAPARHRLPIPPQVEAEIDLHGLSVLLVDDHVDLLELHRRVLFEYGADVITAESAQQALHVLRAQPVDVLLSDLGMPGTDGYGLIHEVRHGLGLDSQRLPAAAVTAFARPQDQERALFAGYQACIIKPVNPATLARAVLDLGRGPAAASPRLRALFVEDNADLQEQIGLMLDEEGLDRVTCATGEDAELEYRKGHFDLVIADVGLPKMSGVDLARILLAQAPDMWIVFSTGYPMGQGLSTLGPRVRALLKPFDSEDLHRVVNEVRAALSADAAAGRLRFLR